MNSGEQNSVARFSGAHAALMDLCRPFVPRDFIAECDLVQPDAIPAPADALLVHHNHMTVELERHYGKPVEVQVLEEHWDHHHYTRKITLTLSGTSHVVERGIARMDTRFVTHGVRAEILAKQSPLGSILIRHQVHRRIKPRHFVRFAPMSPVMELLGGGFNAAAEYGRLGTIYCNDEPAIELLEIVVNTEVKNTP